MAKRIKAMIDVYDSEVHNKILSADELKFVTEYISNLRSELNELQRLAEIGEAAEWAEWNGYWDDRFLANLLDDFRSHKPTSK